MQYYFNRQLTVGAFASFHIYLFGYLIDDIGCKEDRITFGIDAVSTHHIPSFESKDNSEN